jgi:hypothetical protein
MHHLRGPGLQPNWGAFVQKTSSASALIVALAAA